MINIATTNFSGLRTEVANIANNIGTAVVLKYYTRTITGGGSYYDDDVSLAGSGTNQYTSGLFTSLRNRGRDGLLMDRGILLEDDSKLILPGNYDTSGTLKVGIGSPPSRHYAAVQIGPLHATFNESAAYKVLYLRYLPTGSLIGE